jgi:Cu-Zn family superoxide dismutase
MGEIRRTNVKTSMALAAALALATGSAVAQQSPAPSSGQPLGQARATIAGAGITGTAEFRELADGTGRKVEVTITVKGLAPGLHGMHLHSVGTCEGPAFTSAGGHFDPGPFGNTDPDMNHPFHMGDLPNLEASASGEARVTAVTTRVTLSQGPLSVFDPDGTALIIHANPDQGVTGASKSGLSGGPRVACGVLEKK